MILTNYLKKFQQNLTNDTEGKRYLNERQISLETITRFEFGSANEYIKDLGNFISTVVLPSRTIHGEVVGFFGRRTSDIEPKYVISNGYNKKSNILGLYQSYKNILNNGYVIITEGIFDVIMMQQHGFTNTVGAPGKDWSDKQVSLLRRFTDTVILLFDNDATGRLATTNYLKKFYDFGFFVAEVKVPKKYKDVDEFLTKERETGITYLQTIINRRNNINE